MHQVTTAGMTFVEMIMLIAIYTILSLAIMGSVANMYRDNAYTYAQANEVDNARRGMIEWSRHTKEMTTAEDGTYAIAVIEPHRLGYYADDDDDSTVEYIEYSLSTTTLTKEIFEPSGFPATYNFATSDRQEILSEYVQNINQGTSTFFYYDATSTALSASSSLLSVRYIVAQIIVNIDPVRAPGEFMLRSSVAPRNLKDNL